MFGARLRQARELLGITQEGLATRAGIDEFTASARISQYETGKHAPRYEIACRLADALDVPVEFLYSRDDAIAQLLLRWRGATSSMREQAFALLCQEPS